MRSDKDYNTDSVQLKNVPHEANIGDIQKWVLNGIFVALDNIIPDMDENMWIIENQSKDDLEKILTLSKTEMGIGENRRTIPISPITQSSPMKEKRRSMKEYQLQQMKSSNSVPPPSAVTSAEPTSSSSLCLQRQYWCHHLDHCHQPVHCILQCLCCIHDQYWVHWPCCSQKCTYCTYNL